jgi:hypothetical protein
MSVRSLLAVALLSAFVLASLPASAQVPPVAGGPSKVTIVDLAPGPAPVSAGSTHSVGFSVNFQAQGFQCTSASSVTIDLAVTNAGQAPVGVVPVVDPPNLTIAVPGPAVYQSVAPGTPAVPFNGTGTATLRITIGPNAASGSYKATVGASFKSVQPNGCVGTLPDAQDSKNHEITIAGSGGTGGGNTSQPPVGGNNTNMTNPPPSEPPKKSPGLEPLLGAGVLAAVGAARRFRRQD